jgi:nitroreductase
MEFFSVIENRRSVRAYRPAAVEEIKLGRILDAAQKAPSAGGLQAYRIAIAESPGMKQRLAEAAFGQEFLAQAAVVLVFFAVASRSERKYGARGALLYCIQDAALAAAYAQLAAVAEGLGCCWVGAFDEERVSRALGAPVHWRPVALLPVGYGAETPDPTPRRPPSEVIVRERT